MDGSFPEKQESVNRTPGSLESWHSASVVRSTGWMVGDSLEHDITGGTAAGLRTAWIAPPDASVPVGSARYDIHRSSVAEAVATILAV